MKLAVMILCHKNAAQVERLLRALRHPNVDCFVHVDKKSDMAFADDCGARFVSEDRRQDVQWGRISLVYAELELIRLARASGHYDYYLVVSGQDFLLRRVDELLDFLEENRGTDFINLSCNRRYMKRVELFYPNWMVGPRGWRHVFTQGAIRLTGGWERTLPPFKRRGLPVERFAFGSSWWCLTDDTLSAIARYADENPRILKFFRNTLCPDESFFQTARQQVRPDAPQKRTFWYIDWSARKGSPKTLTMEDYDKLIASDCYFARKLDINVDAEILDALEKRL